MVRIAAGLLLIFCLAGCHRGVENNDAVRQGVLDYLATKGMTPAAMDINLTSVKFNGDKADATVSFAAKGSGAGQMTIQYHLEMKDNKWVVVGRKDAGQHGAAQVPAEGAPQERRRATIRMEAPCQRRARAARCRRRRICRLPAKRNEACRNSGWRSGGGIRGGKAGVGRTRRGADG